MFYDQTGAKIRENSVVNFGGEAYKIVSINGDSEGVEGTSTLTLDRKPHVDAIPCEMNVTVIEY